jgi:DNA polymerase I-like protein with 3'-5' exonuclease and polymerase domains
MLLFQVMGFEPIEYTDAGAAKTDRATVSELLLGASEDQKVILDALISISETAIVKNTFLTAFKELSLKDKEGNYTLHGNHNLGAVMSGRLSSNQP